MAQDLSTRLDSLPDFTGALLRSRRGLTADIKQHKPDYDANDPRTWPVMTQRHFDVHPEGEYCLLHVAHRSDIAVELASQDPNVDVPVRVEMSDAAIMLNDRFFRFPFTYKREGYRRTSDILPAADLRYWVAAVSGSLPNDLRITQDAEQVRPKSCDEAFEQALAILDDTHAESAIEMCALKREVSDLKDEISASTAREAGLVAELQTLRTACLEQAVQLEAEKTARAAAEGRVFALLDAVKERKKRVNSGATATSKAS